MRNQHRILANRWGVVGFLRLDAEFLRFSGFLDWLGIASVSLPVLDITRVWITGQVLTRATLRIECRSGDRFAFVGFSWDVRRMAELIEHRLSPTSAPPSPV
jgi:hypothetical protein